MGDEFYEELKAVVGVEDAPRVALDEVCKPMIRHWCAAMEDGNPLYTDEEYAKNSKHGGVVAPPHMLLTWTMPPLWPASEYPPHPFEKFLAKLDEAEYLGIVVTNVTQKFLLPVRPGDLLSYTYKVTDLSEEKTTGVGKGFFVTTTFEFTNQKEEAVGQLSFTVLKYKIG